MPDLGMDFWAISVLILADTVLYCVGRKIVSTDKALSSKGIPLFFSMCVAATALLVHLIAVGVAAGVSDVYGNKTGSLALLGISVITGIGPCIVYGYMIMQSSAALGQELVMGKEEDAKEVFDRTKALALLKEGRVEAALAEYRLQARAFPESPEPICAVANLLEQQHKLKEAAALWRDIRDRFPSHEPVQKQVGAHLKQIGQTLTRKHDGLGTGDLKPDQNFDYNTPDLKQSMAQTRPTKTAPPPAGNMEAAHRQAKQGDVDHAVGVYRKYYRALETPEPRPLFAAAIALQQAERYEDAKTTLQEIGRTFNDDDRIWAKAMFNLASLLHAHLFDTSSAQYILKQVQSRMPGTEQALQAREHLDELSR